MTLTEKNKIRHGIIVAEVINEWTNGSRKIKQSAVFEEAAKRYNEKNGTNVSEATVRRAWLEFRERLVDLTVTGCAKLIASTVRVDEKKVDGARWLCVNNYRPSCPLVGRWRCNLIRQRIRNKSS